MNFTVDVEQSTDAVFVGEPTGARPNLYGDVRPVQMPSSGLVAHVSSRYWPKAGDTDTLGRPSTRTSASSGPSGTSSPAGTQCSMPPSRRCTDRQLGAHRGVVVRTSSGATHCWTGARARPSTEDPG